MGGGLCQQGQRHLGSGDHQPHLRRWPTSTTWWPPPW